MHPVADPKMDASSESPDAGGTGGGKRQRVSYDELRQYNFKNSVPPPELTHMKAKERHMYNSATGMVP